MKTHFVQPFGSYPNPFLVIIGHAGAEVLEIARGFTFTVDDETTGRWEKFLQNLEKDILSIDTEICSGSVWTDDEESFGILWMREWRGDLGSRATLIHELHHAVHFMLGKFRNMEDEHEALAYQQEYLYREIERRLEEERVGIPVGRKRAYSATELIVESAGIPVPDGFPQRVGA